MTAVNPLNLIVFDLREITFLILTCIFRVFSNFLVNAGAEEKYESLFL